MIHRAAQSKMLLFEKGHAEARETRNPEVSGSSGIFTSCKLINARGDISISPRAPFATPDTKSRTSTCNLSRLNSRRPCFFVARIIALFK